MLSLALGLEESFLLPSPCPPCTPTGLPGLRPFAVAAMLGRCGGGVGGRRGSGPRLAQRNTCTPPTGSAHEHDLEQADPSIGHQCPDTQQDSKAKQEAAPRQGKSLQLSRITKQVPARQTQDCLQGERKATSCLWVSGKGWS